METGTAVATGAPSGKTPDQLLIGHFNAYNVVDLRAQILQHPIQGLCLGNSPGKTIQHVTFGAVRLLNPLFDDTNYH